MAISRSQAAIVAAIGLAVLVGGLRYFRAQAPVPVVQAMGCADIVKGCHGDRLSVRMDRAPEVMRPFRLEVAAPQAGSMEASFNMAGMEMGFNRYRLMQRSDRVWEAEVTLPVCVRNRRDWLLLLDVTEGSARRQVAVPFQTQ